MSQRELSLLLLLLPGLDSDNERPTCFQLSVGDWLAGLETAAFPELDKHWGNIFHAEQCATNCPASGTNCCLGAWAAEEQARKGCHRREKPGVLALQAERGTCRTMGMLCGLCVQWWGAVYPWGSWGASPLTINGENRVLQRVLKTVDSGVERHSLWMQ